MPDTSRRHPGSCSSCGKWHDGRIGCDTGIKDLPPIDMEKMTFNTVEDNKDTVTTASASKTPREFRNALYHHFIDNDVSEAIATTLAAESELYVEAYHAYQLRGVEFAAKQMGFDPEKMRREAAA